MFFNQRWKSRVTVLIIKDPQIKYTCRWGGTHTKFAKLTGAAGDAVYWLSTYQYEIIYNYNYAAKP